MPSRDFKRSFVHNALRIYVAGYVCAWLLLQVRLFRAEGAFSWALFGWLVPFFEALLWPALLVAWIRGTG